jgi:hypothetical protein
VTNQDDASIFLTQFASLTELDKGVDFPNPQRLDVGADFLFTTGSPPFDDPNDNKIAWRQVAVCGPDVTGDGFELTAAFDANSENYRFVIFCDQARVSTVDSGGSNRRRQRKKKSQRQGAKRRKQ